MRGTRTPARRGMSRPSPRRYPCPRSGGELARSMQPMARASASPSAMPPDHERVKNWFAAGSTGAAWCSPAPLAAWRPPRWPCPACAPRTPPRRRSDDRGRSRRAGGDRGSRPSGGDGRHRPHPRRLPAFRAVPGGHRRSGRGAADPHRRPRPRRHRGRRRLLHRPPAPQRAQRLHGLPRPALRPRSVHGRRGHPGRSIGAPPRRALPHRHPRPRGPGPGAVRPGIRQPQRRGAG